MSAERSYGVLSQSSPDSIDFTVAGHIQQSWRVTPPLTSVSELRQRCLFNLAREGWRPISHQPNPAEAVVLARVPYPAGSKLAVYGTLRFVEGDLLVLTVSGATMQRWQSRTGKGGILADALADLERQGWRVHRRYPSGATVVRG